MSYSMSTVVPNNRNNITRKIQLLLPLYNNLIKEFTTSNNINISLKSNSSSNNEGKINIQIENKNAIIILDLKNQDEYTLSIKNKQIGSVQKRIFTLENYDGMILAIRKALTTRINMVAANNTQRPRNLNMVAVNNTRLQYPRTIAYQPISQRSIEIHTKKFWNEYFKEIFTTSRNTLRYTGSNLKTRILNNNPTIDSGNKISENDYKNSNEYKKIYNSTAISRTLNNMF